MDEKIERLLPPQPQGAPRKTEGETAGQLFLAEGKDAVKVTQEQGPATVTEAARAVMSPQLQVSPARIDTLQLRITTEEISEKELDSLSLVELEKLGDLLAIEYRVAKSFSEKNLNPKILTINLDHVLTARNKKIENKSLSQFQKACNLARSLVYDIKDSTKLGLTKDKTEIEIHKRSWIFGLIGFGGLSGRSQEAKDAALKLLEGLEQAKGIEEKNQVKEVLSLLGKSSWFQSVLKDPAVFSAFQRVQDKKKLSNEEYAQLELKSINDAVDSVVQGKRKILIGRRGGEVVERKQSYFGEVGTSQTSRESVLWFVAKAKGVALLLQSDPHSSNRLRRSLDKLESSEWFQAVREHNPDIKASFLDLKKQLDAISFVEENLTHPGKVSLIDLQGKASELSENFGVIKSELLHKINGQLVSAQFVRLKKAIEEAKDISSLNKIQEQLDSFQHYPGGFEEEDQDKLNHYQRETTEKAKNILRPRLQEMQDELPYLSEASELERLGNQCKELLFEGKNLPGLKNEVGALLKEIDRKLERSLLDDPVRGKTFDLLFDKTSFPDEQGTINPTKLKDHLQKLQPSPFRDAQLQIKGIGDEKRQKALMKVWAEEDGKREIMHLKGIFEKASTKEAFQSLDEKCSRLIEQAREYDFPAVPAQEMQAKIKTRLEILQVKEGLEAFKNKLDTFKETAQLEQDLDRFKELQDQLSSLKQRVSNFDLREEASIAALESRLSEKVKKRTLPHIEELRKKSESAGKPEEQERMQKEYEKLLLYSSIFDPTLTEGLEKMRVSLESSRLAQDLMTLTDEVREWRPSVTVERDREKKLLEFQSRFEKAKEKLGKYQDREDIRDQLKLCSTYIWSVERDLILENIQRFATQPDSVAMEKTCVLLADLAGRASNDQQKMICRRLYLQLTPYVREQVKIAEKRSPPKTIEEASPLRKEMFRAFQAIRRINSSKDEQKVGG